jgi:hypothetical protein
VGTAMAVVRPRWPCWQARCDSGCAVWACFMRHCWFCCVTATRQDAHRSLPRSRCLRFLLRPSPLRHPTAVHSTRAAQYGPPRCSPLHASIRFALRQPSPHRGHPARTPYDPILATHSWICCTPTQHANPPVHRILLRSHSPQRLRRSTPPRHPPVTPLIPRVRPAPRGTPHAHKLQRLPSLSPLATPAHIPPALPPCMLHVSPAPRAKHPCPGCLRHPSPRHTLLPPSCRPCTKRHPASQQCATQSRARNSDPHWHRVQASCPLSPLQPPPPACQVVGRLGHVRVRPVRRRQQDGGRPVHGRPPGRRVPSHGGGAAVLALRHSHAAGGVDRCLGCGSGADPKGLRAGHGAAATSGTRTLPAGVDGA